ncbi:thymidylate synthase [Dinoroseobacter phage vB_DshS-R5C]|uniref:Thymidylate synthase n=1 Tax=Dinoroseobacter phage vB_DshS-R5C TaxID=1965368 RepID=A0A1V0DY98_9CAUD|nr:thymidylate synthase [Dinoroseobacter phage vB_DshS-R5C]ARB06125.1 thymidylate synthase [Dinoroseobacter phage vB_DshS-R5C]
MTSLIWQPDVFAIGQTQWNVDDFHAWIGHNGFQNHTVVASEGGSTPLGNLWLDVEEDDAIERMIEFGGRHCYRAWQSGRDRASYIKNIIEMEHGSVLEHSSINWAVQGVSRSLSLELARHRVGIALSQESQRYVDAKDIEFVVPPMVQYLAGGSLNGADMIQAFADDCAAARASYIDLQERIVAQIKATEPNIKSLTMVKKRANEAARAHLPNAAETRFLWTTNMRLLRHFLWLRGGSGADLEIRRLACFLLGYAHEKAPAVFHDMTLSVNDGAYGVPIIVSNA